MSKLSIPVLYEDSYLMVFNKPSGLLVIPSPKQEMRTLTALVNAQFVDHEGGAHLHPCHRLDRDTSGAIIFARGKKMQQQMMQCFQDRQVQKRYTAFVQGRLEKSSGELRRSVVHLEKRQRQHSNAGRSAITRYQVVKTCKNFSVLDVNPITGRTNQIRIHFSQIKHPLLGERKYAFARDYDLKFRRTALHASCVQWVHPITKVAVKVEAPLAQDMVDFLMSFSRKRESRA